MSSSTTMWEVEQQYHHLIKQEAYAEAHKLITKKADIFDYHAQNIVYYWRFWTAAMLDEAALTLKLLAEAINVETFAKEWETAVQHGWLVGLPQSSQMREQNVYTWDDWEWSIEEIRQQYSTLCTEYPVDCQQTVLAGFSMGGGLATSLALSGKIKPKGLILIAPFLNDADNMISYLKTRAKDDLRAYIIATEHDTYCRDIGQRLAELLPQYGIPCKFEVYPDLEHSFPPAFAQKLPQALDFVMK